MPLGGFDQIDAFVDAVVQKTILAEDWVRRNSRYIWMVIVSVFAFFLLLVLAGLIARRDSCLWSVLFVLVLVAYLWVLLGLEPTKPFIEPRKLKSALTDRIRELISAPAEVAYWVASRIGTICILTELLWLCRWKPWANQYLRWRFSTFLAEVPDPTPLGFLCFIWRHRRDILRFARWAACTRWGSYH